MFREPWEAQAFAMALALHERGVFSWPEWATMLATELKDAHGTDDADTDENYYHHWLAALERLLTEKGVTDSRMLARYRNAWRRATGRSPHGTPIELRPQDFS